MHLLSGSLMCSVIPPFGRILSGGYSVPSSMATSFENYRIQSMFDIQAVRSDFPILARQVHGQPLVYFDNAATSQKPQIFG
jgi:hypothetical protein